VTNKPKAIPLRKKADIVPSDKKHPHRKSGSSAPQLKAVVATKKAKAPAKAVKTIPPAPVSPKNNISIPAAAAPISRGEKKKYYDALNELRDQVIGQVRNLTAASLTSNKQAGEELADIGSDNFNREIGLAMVTEDGKKLSLIQEAIERLTANTYGICFDCGKTIGKGRLQAIPYAKLCIDCKSAREEMEKMEINEEELFFDKETETTTFDKTDDEEQDEEREGKDGEEEEKD